MALNFDRPAQQAQPTLTLEPVEVKPYDVIEDRDRTVAQLVDSEEIDRLTSQIDINDMTTIVTFGARTVEEISKASDVVLRSMNMGQMDQSSQMLESLAKIMSRFDIDEFKDSPKLFGRLLGNVRGQLERILTKYNTMGDEVDKIYVQLKGYEAEIKRSNQKLEQMFQSNVQYFHELEKYIVAGDQGCKEIEDYMAQRQQDLERTGDQSISFELQTLEQAKTMLEQRTLDLRTAEAVALQSIPMLKAMQYNNMNLVRKINSAFIITLPVFKQALAQAILLKRQKLQSDAMSVLDQRTNEMLLKNARNTVAQTKATARLAGAPSIQADTLQKTWQTIVGGIEETQKLQASARDQRKQDQVKLENIRRDFMRKYNAPK
ncbi:MAG: toxic anion resistance protein [Clostridia bacterium]|nr:toxic anion resistance protein [Clostridia bacterium]